MGILREIPREVKIILFTFSGFILLVSFIAGFTATGTMLGALNMVVDIVAVMVVMIGTLIVLAWTGSKIFKE